jgi:hypothetical protein
MAIKSKSHQLTEKERSEFQAQLDDPESPVSRAVRDRAQFFKAAESPDSSLRRSAAARFAEPEEREASWQLVATRVPADMKREIEAAAAASGRTVASEVRWRLALTDYNLQLVAELDQQHKTLTAALADDWSGEELKKLLRIYMGAIEVLSFRLRPLRQAHFVAKDR